jgi:hypothetical protein
MIRYFSGMELAMIKSSAYVSIIQQTKLALLYFVWLIKKEVQLISLIHSIIHI